MLQLRTSTAKSINNVKKKKEKAKCVACVCGFAHSLSRL